MSEVFKRARKLKLALFIRLLEVVQEQAAKQSGQDSNWEKKAGPAGDPSSTVQ
jgi:hypothetical protein